MANDKNKIQHYYLNDLLREIKLQNKHSSHSRSYHTINKLHYIVFTHAVSAETIIWSISVRPIQNSNGGHIERFIREVLGRYSFSPSSSIQV